MKQHIAFLTIAALISVFVLTGCIGTPDSKPGKMIIVQETTLGEYESKTTVEVPQDVRGGLFYFEGPTLDSDLENLEDLGELAQVLSTQEQEAFKNLVASGADDETKHSWLVELFGDKGYIVHSPVLDKSHRGFRVLLINGEIENNPEVIAATVELSKAISENNKEAMMHSLTVLKELGVELGPQIIEQLVTPGL
ncbi:MAG: hypothetical protein AAFX93_14130 [Verrucomicrobiota bacterium]